MALWIRDTNAVPDGGWRYPHVAPDKFVHAPNYNALYPAVVNAYAINEQPPPSQEQVINWLCTNLSIPCFEGNQALVNKFVLGLPTPVKGCCGK